MIARIMILLIVLPFSLPVIGQPGFGKAEKLDKNWSFYLNEEDTVGIYPRSNVSWKMVDLPHDWSIEQPLNSSHASCMGYLPGGIGWYKKKVNIPRRGGKLYLYFEGVYNRSEVFVNGKSVGKRPNGYISFIYDITPYVQFGQENEILVKADHHRSADSRWYTGSGIYRNVWLVSASSVHLDTWGVYAYPEVNESRGTLKVETTVKNTGSQPVVVAVKNELVDPRGHIVAAQKKLLTIQPVSVNSLQTQLTVQNPRIWSLEAPALYELRTTVFNGSRIIDFSTMKSGFRQFTFDADKGFALNGKWMKVKGVCLHHDAGVLGAAMYKEVWRRRLVNLKKIGCNAIRTSHNPQATALYELCDELGLLVLNEAFDEWEFPKRKWLEGWNVGKPGYQGSYDFFNTWGEQDLRDMVKRDRNHLSIFAWSIGNEVDYPNDPYSHPVLDGVSESGFTQKIFGGYKKEAPDAMRLGVIAKKLVDVVKKYDRSRPVTAGLAGIAMSNETEYPSSLDIAGYNYTESRYESDHKKYPRRVIYGSENRHDFKAWKAVTDNEHIFGQFLWTGIDYLGESGKWPSRGFYSGLLDFGGFIKPRGFFRQALWSTQPVIYLGTYAVSPKKWSAQEKDVLSATENSDKKQSNIPVSMDAWPVWNYEPGEKVRVVCYTNAYNVKLKLNGKYIHTKGVYDATKGIWYWDLSYQSGELEAVGIDKNGKKHSRYVLKTTGKPEKIDVTVIEPSGSLKSEIIQIVVETKDADNNTVLTADNEITCTIDGAGKLLGLEAGNNTDMGDYTDNQQRVYKGRMMAYIRRNNHKEAIKITFSGPGLQPESTIIAGLD